MIIDMDSIRDRAQEPLGLDFYSQPNHPERVAKVALNPPQTRQYVLRCPIVIPGHELTIPDEMGWTADFVHTSFDYQRERVGVEQPYTYLTIRHGVVSSETDDAFHVDGFSMKVPHIPEQNYVWTDHKPTEVLAFGLDIPQDFDPLRHNIQYLIQDSIPEDALVEALDPETVYAMDPYVFHRRPELTEKVSRTFLRLSMTPIPIDDVNNHTNPAFGVITSTYDGVVDFRNKLERYPIGDK